MASSPGLPVRWRPERGIKPLVQNPARGQKLPLFKSAARSSADRGYIPRYDLDD